jgi:hypothetical protein
MSAGGFPRIQPAGDQPDQPKEGGNGAWAFYLAAAALALIGLFQLNGYRYALAAEHNWTRASGMVTSQSVHVSYGRHSDSYTTFITYSYAALGGVYSAGPVEVKQHKFFFSENDAQETLNRDFPQGGSLPVYYNPTDPGDSSLGVAGSSGLMAPLAFLFLAGGAVYFGKQQSD